jgi:shikimate kinase / 3-dehydroquinate synthase
MSLPSTGRVGVVLGGFMGVGKSTVGRRLASVLGLPFIDADLQLAARHGPIADQIAGVGERTFRAREAALLLGLCDGVPRVIATGGGAFAQPHLREALRAAGFLVTLSAPLPVLRRRVGDGVGRPLWDVGVAALLARRRPHYADVDLVVDADRPEPAVVDDITRWLTAARDVPVPASSGAYTVAIRSDLRGLGAAVRRATGASAVAVVTESRVAPLWLEPARRALAADGVAAPAPIVLPAGEEHKTVEVWRACLDALIARGVSRDVPVVALGGGVLGDVAGFAAATALRGLPLVQVPTTLLAMVDSSVGGKVAVDHPSGKNLIGAFHQPALVWAPLSTLDTLPAREVRAGLAEVVKVALLFDADLYEALERLPADRLPAAGALADLIARAVALKAAVVSDDEREAGPRALLNLGHTVGHAVEAAAGFGQVLHGEAVAIGLVAEARVAAELGFGPADLPARVEALLRRLGLPTRSPLLASDAAARAVSLDKKRRGAMLTWPVALAVGRSALRAVPVDLFFRTLANLR